MAHYAYGSGELLSRRLRALLINGTREISRMGWAPVRNSAAAAGGTKEGAAAAGGAAAAPVARVPTGGGASDPSDAWGTSWKVSEALAVESG
jgi:hypothetical protein